MSARHLEPSTSKAIGRNFEARHTISRNPDENDGPHHGPFLKTQIKRTTIQLFFLQLLLIPIFSFLLLTHAKATSTSSSSSMFIGGAITPTCRSAAHIHVPWAKLFSLPENGLTRPLYILVDYSPPRGNPASPFTLNPPLHDDHQFNNNNHSHPPELIIPITGTWSSVGYHFHVRYVLATKTNKLAGTNMSDNNNNNIGDSVLLHQGITYSSPGKPILVSVSTTDRTCTLAYSATPEPYAHRDDFSFHLEYFPVDHPETVFFARTNASSVRLRRLRPSTQYRVALYAEFFSVRSLCPLELTFRTKSEQRRNTINETINNGNNTDKMDATNKERNGGNSSCSTLLITTTSTPPKVDAAATDFVTDGINNDKGNITGNLSTTTTTETNKNGFKTKVGLLNPEVKTTRMDNATFPSSTTITPVPSGQGTTVVGDEQQQQQVDVQISNNATTNVDVEAASEQIKEGPSTEEKEAEEVEDDVDALPKSGKSAFSIRMRQLTPSLLELSWDLPEQVPCDAFLVQHNASKRGERNESHIVALRTSTPLAQIPFMKDALFMVNISCLFENSISPQWSAHRMINLNRPNPLRSMRLIRSWTDENFSSSVLLGFALPTSFTANNEDNNPFHLYELQVAWALGKKVVGKHSRVFHGEDIQNGEGRMNITGLESARLYTFAVRNVSRELSAYSSPPIGLRLTTPPVITAALDSGKITSRSINVNIGESDPAHPFDHYELHFGAAENIEDYDSDDDDDGISHSTEDDEDDANRTRSKTENNQTTPATTIVRRLGKLDSKSLTFSKLIPGRTYRLSLYTVLKGVRSRPVTSLITTYPLKVASLHPLIAPGSVLLFWTVQNPAHSRWYRFRLSYTASAGPHIHRAVSVELNGTVQRHRFTGLDWNTFYTFTSTVIMGPPGAEAESESESVTIGIAGKPRSIPLLQRYGSRELVLTFENDREMFTDRNGVISHFTIIVAEQTDGTPEQVGDIWELPSWYDVRERADGIEQQWDAFCASPSDYNPFKRQNAPRSVQFVIGSEDCTIDRRRLDEPYCNGPLRAHLDYWVKVRAYTVAGIATETQWVGVDGRQRASLSEAGAKKGGAGNRENEEQQKRRFPCYLYLNGCNTNSEAGGKTMGTIMLAFSITAIFICSLSIHIFISR